MTASLVIVPGLGGSTSETLAVVKSSSAGGLRSKPADVSAATADEVPSSSGDLPTRRQVLDRLAELRELAAARQRSMPTYEDSIEASQDSNDERDAWNDLQAATSAWAERH